MRKIQSVAVLLFALACLACTEDEVLDFGSLPTGDFTFTPTAEPRTIQFNAINITGDSVLVAWIFGFEGEGSFSLELNPLVEFPEAGTYNVNLVLTTDAGITSVRKDVPVP